MKEIILVLMLISPFWGFAQITVDELESAIKKPLVYSKDITQRKRNIDKLLTLDKYNYVANYSLIELYKNYNPELIEEYWNTLIAQDPYSPQPYVLRAKCYEIENKNNPATPRIVLLNKGYLLDSTDFEVNFELGKIYYQLFITAFKNRDISDSINKYATFADFYLNKAMNKTKNYQDMLSYVLAQLSSYLGNNNKMEFYKNKKFSTFSYFPISEYYPKNTFPFDHYNIDIFAMLEDYFFTVKWYDKHLKAMQEPKLWNYTDNDKIIRFTWLRTFDQPIAIRVEKTDKEIRLYSKVTDGQGGYEPGKLIADNSKEITPQEYDTLMLLLDKSNFWNTPAYSNLVEGLDGSQWIIECVKNGNYHFVKRWNGQKNKEIGLYLIKLGNINIEEHEIY